MDLKAKAALTAVVRAAVIGAAPAHAKGTGPGVSCLTATGRGAWRKTA
ncbi:hypothetical protein [Streptomyces sp. NBC_00557]|jgi:hypothetical protein|nr:hypothetical protein [Streptomyces sp. NBC_00557]WUC36519.1 hypothetical protein OG956_20975 [Streptomyces sp. NBC_00557]